MRTSLDDNAVSGGVGVCEAVTRDQSLAWIAGRRCPSLCSNFDDVRSETPGNRVCKRYNTMERFV
jgi:hypothetical protein